MDQSFFKIAACASRGVRVVSVFWLDLCSFFVVTGRVFHLLSYLAFLFFFLAVPVVLVFTHQLRGSSAHGTVIVCGAASHKAPDLVSSEKKGFQMLQLASSTALPSWCGSAMDLDRLEISRITEWFPCLEIRLSRQSWWRNFTLSTRLAGERRLCPRSRVSTWAGPGLMLVLGKGDGESLILGWCVSVATFLARQGSMINGELFVQHEARWKSKASGGCRSSWSLMGTTNGGEPGDPAGSIETIDSPGTPSTNLEEDDQLSRRRCSIKNLWTSKGLRIRVRRLHWNTLRECKTLFRRCCSTILNGGARAAAAKSRRSAARTVNCRMCSTTWSASTVSTSVGWSRQRRSCVSSCKSKRRSKRTRSSLTLRSSFCSRRTSSTRRTVRRDQSDFTENGADDPPITPFWNACLRASARERRKLLLRLHELELVPLRLPLWGGHLCRLKEGWNSAFYRGCGTVQRTLTCSSKGRPWDGDGAPWIGLKYVKILNAAFCDGLEEDLCPPQWFLTDFVRSSGSTCWCRQKNGAEGDVQSGDRTLWNLVSSSLVFDGLPQGFSWSLLRCNETIAATATTQGCLRARSRRPPLSPTPQHPVFLSCVEGCFAHKTSSTGVAVTWPLSGCMKRWKQKEMTGVIFSARFPIMDGRDRS